MGKGSQQRPGDDEKFRREWERIYGRKEKEKPKAPEPGPAGG